MLLLGVKNFTSQDVLAGGLINLGQVDRRYCRKNTCGIRTFDFAGTSITLNHSGIYKITATATFTAPVAGDVTISLFENGVAIPGASATETITTATTESRSIALDYFVLVDSSCVLGVNTTIGKTITLVNTGVASTITNVVVDVVKVG